MRMGIVAKTCLTAVIAALTLFGCSSQQQQEDQLETSEEQQEEQEQWTEQEEQDQGEMGSGLANLDMDAPAEPAPQPAAFTGSTAPDAQRVVRFITDDDTPVYSQANDEGDSVGTLQRGDRVMVIEDGDWAKLSDQMFIKIENLTERAVSRTRRAKQWNQ